LISLTRRKHKADSVGAHKTRDAGFVLYDARMKRAAFWIGGAALLCGMGLGVVMPVTPPFYYFLLVLTLAVACVGAFHHTSMAVLIIVGGISFIVGMARVSVIDTVHDAVLSEHIGRSAVLVGAVSDSVEERDGYARITVDVKELRVASSTVDVSATVLASVPPHSVVERGDTVILRGRLAVPRAFETDAGRVFAYDTFLAARSIGYTMSFATVSIEERGSWSLRRTLESWRSWYEKGLSYALVEPYASLASGITVGSRQGISKDLYDVFRDAGLVHIVVLSGYNITVVVGALFYMLARVSRRTKVVVALGMITLFVLLTGAAAPVVRAALMVSVALVAPLYARPSVAGRSLMLAVVAMVLYEPRVLVYDPGFHLSFLATLGIIYVAPLLESRLAYVPTVMGWREIVGTTLATQFTVLPYLLYTMGEISVVGLIANVLVLPALPFAMATSALAGVYGSTVAIGASFVALPAHVSLWYVVHVAELSAHVPWSVVGVPRIPVILPLVLYGMGVFLVYRMWHARMRQVY
jgi:competence protein ComEC